MASYEKGISFITEIVQIFGLERVTKLQLNTPLDGVVTLQVEFLTTTEQCAGIVKVLKKYELVERKAK